MTLFHKYDVLLTKKGDALPGHQVIVKDSGSGAVVPIFSDQNGTPIAVVSGIANTAITDEAGNFSLFVAFGTYDLEYRSPDSVLIGLTRQVPMNGGATGATGPSNNTRLLLADLKAAATSDKTSLYDGSLWTWTPGNYTGQADDVNIVKADSTALSVGAWVRQKASGISFKSGVTSATTRDTNQKLADVISVMDFGADPTGATDCTAAFNRACSVALPTTGNDDQPKREIFVPAGKYRIDGTVYVRKGQHLRGSGLGCYIDCTQRTVGKAAFMLGSNANGLDPGGLGTAISHLWFHGLLAQDGNESCIEPTDAGFWIDHCFFTACSIGIQTKNSTNSGDGMITQCQIDLGLTGMVFRNLGNTIISNCNFFDSSYGIRILERCRNITISSSIFEYQHNACVLLGTGGGDPFNSRGIVICDNQFFQNAQHTTFLGAIIVGGAGVEAEILGGNVFWNLYGPAIRWVSGAGSKVLVNGALFDGRRTFVDAISPDRSYAQSTTMGGIDASNMSVIAKACVFRNLPGQPVRFDGALSGTLEMSDCTFTGNTGGLSEITVSNASSASRVYLNGCTSDGGGRVLINQQATVPVLLANSDDRNGIPSVSSAATIIIPPGKDIVFVTGTTNITAITMGWAGQRVTLCFSAALTVTDGGNLALNGNFVTTVNDCLTLFCDGTTWFEISRSPN